MKGEKSKLKKAAVRIFNFAFDLIFPKFCSSCDQEGSFLCKKCAGQILIFNFAVCPVCKRKIIHEGTKLKLCHLCRSKTNIKFLIAATTYDNTTVRDLVAKFKYSKAYQIKEVFDEWLECTTANFDFSDFLIVPVPLHKKRQRQRGFNQSQILAKEFARRRNLEITPALQKIKEARPQIELSGEQRRQNLNGVFNCSNPNLINKRKILLIDDVYTTSTTMNECARVLKKNGAKEIWALTIAR
jgi:ComF family protein